jgi:hypothetical protein
MKGLKIFVLAVVAGLCFTVAVQKASAQVNINVQIGPAPVCPYGYYDYAPYSCAPVGYYGPRWFVSGVFVGAGPWFYGPEGFHGEINRAFDPRYGYVGPLPRRGEHADWGRHRGWEKHFRGEEVRPEYRHDNGHHYGEYKDHDRENGNGHGNGKGHGHGHDD